ncbi:MAG: hypothetical protein HQK96_03810 [Nitrospirae bacterium]|nr:hypothetical protein [Nitrospirota bacterium]
MESKFIIQPIIDGLLVKDGSGTKYYKDFAEFIQFETRQLTITIKNDLKP